MRPQHITAENGEKKLICGLEELASMRPQHITAENESTLADPLLDVRASMRPQHITAENSSGGLALSESRTLLQ